MEENVIVVSYLNKIGNRKMNGLACLLLSRIDM